MKRNEAIQTLIDRTMDEFDARKCIDVMTYLGWGWRTEKGDMDTEVPSEGMFRSSLRSSIKNAFNGEGSYSGGILTQAGDSIDVETGMPFVYLRASFVLESNLTIDGEEYEPEEEDLRFRVLKDQEPEGKYSIIDTLNDNVIATGVKNRESAYAICNIYRKDARDGKGR